MTDYTIEQLLDLEQVRHLLESHQRLSGMAYGLFNTDENCLINVGCQEICLHFHCSNPIAAARCRESKAFVKSCWNSATGDFFEYRCKNGMIEIAMPLIIDSRHLATFFAGQFFYKNDLPDRVQFIKQAEELGFDKDAYLALLAQVPVFSPEYIRNNLLFLHAMVQLLAETGLKNLRLARKMEQRKQTDRQLLLLNSALNNSRDAAYLIDDQFHFIYVNDVACRTLGYSREELLTMGISDIDPDLNDEALTRIAQHTRTIGANSIETRHRAKDGRIFPAEVTGTVFEHEGQYYNLALARDISERKQSEQQIELLNHALDQVREGAFLMDDCGRFLYVNLEACRSLGYTRDELLTMAIPDINPDFSRERMVKSFADLLRQGSHTFETRHRAKDGRIFTVEITSTLLEYGDSRYTLALVRDIAERKRVEDTLRFISQRNWLGDTGNFLTSLAQQLGENLGMEYVIIDRLCENNPGIAETAALYAKGSLLPAMRYPLKDTPCDNVMAKALCSYPCNIQELFPADPLLVEMGVECYVGIPLWDSTGSPIGLLAVLDSKPLQNEAEVAHILQLAAPSAAAALEREHSNLLQARREREFRALAENSPDSILRYNTFCRCIYANPLIEKTLGIPAGSMPGKTPTELFPTGEYREYQNRIEEVLRTGRDAELEVVVPDIGEGVQYHHIRFTAEFSEQGEVTGVLVIGHDITGYRQAEQVSQARLRMLETAYAPDISPDDTLRLMLDEIEAQTGSSIGFYHFLNEDQQTLSLQNWSTNTLASSCMAKGKGNHYTVTEAGVWADCVRERRPVIHNDYASLPERKGVPDSHAPVIRELVVPIFRGERIVAVIGVGNKPTEYTETDVQIATLLGDFSWEIASRKQAENALKRREREFRTLAENSPDNIVRYDTGCRMIYVNPRMEKTVGMPAAVLIGKTPLTKAPGEERREYQQRIEQVLETGEETELDLVLPDRGEGERYHHIRFVAERDANGTVSGVLAIGRDITERRRAEQQIREHQQRLNDMALELTMSEERERHRIAIDLHDTLGQDLTLARMKLGGLNKTALSAEQEKVIAEIKKSTENAISRVRSLTRLLSPPIMESAGLEAALKWLARQIESDYGLQIAFYDDLSDKPVIREFQLELYNSVRELLINVAKHAGTTTACLTVCREANTLAIKVEDDGAGFEADAVLNGSNSDGFGLYTIKHRIIHMGGVFDIRTKPDSGTEVTINVPLSKQAAQDRTTGEQP